MTQTFSGELPKILRILAFPAGVLPFGPALTRAVRRLARRRPEVFERLGPFGRSSFLIEPTDLDISFLMIPAGREAQIRCVRRGADLPSDVQIRAPLLVLLGLLDGTFDGDALFFNRVISVSGRTDALVALRNAIEEAELSPSNFLGIGGMAAKVLDGSVSRGLDIIRHFSETSAYGRPS